jgi:hypothetical protein
MGVNVVSFSVWGTDRHIYTYGVLDNCIYIKQHMPDYEVWVYTNSSLPIPIRDCLQELGNVKIITMTEEDTLRNTMWRMLPAFDPTVNILLVRDADSRIGVRELAAVAEWLKSDKPFHIMRDHNKQRMRILGGMWGCRDGVIRHLKPLYYEMMNSSAPWIYGTDEAFLAKSIYPVVVYQAFVHAPWNAYETHARPFPTARDSDIRFVGMPIRNVRYITQMFPGLSVPSLKKP